jgi:hypothetical protein
VVTLTPPRARPSQGHMHVQEGSLALGEDRMATRLDVASLTWLIAQLMHTSEPGAPSQHMGQPCVSMRDRILLLLRPMMNFQEKVVYFQDEQDRILDYQLTELGDDETMHIEVHRGDDVLGDTVEQISKVGEEGLMRELTVSFVDEDGEDGGGLLKEFCQVSVPACKFWPFQGVHFSSPWVFRLLVGKCFVGDCLLGMRADKLQSGAPTCAARVRIALSGCTR